MVSQEMNIKILKGETSPSITLYYSDADDHDKALASLPEDIQAKIYSGTSKADTTKGMSYISFPLDGRYTEQALQFMDDQKPFPGPLSDNFRKNVNAIADKFKEGAFASPEEASEAAIKDPDVAAADNILLLQMANLKRPDITKVVLEDSAEIANIINSGSHEELLAIGLPEKTIAAYNSAKQLDGNSDNLSAAEAASLSTAQAQLIARKEPITLETLAPLAAAAYTEIYSKASDVSMDDVCAPAAGVNNPAKSSERCK